MAASVEYHLTVYTRNGESIQVVFMLGFGRLEQIYHREIYKNYYSLVHQCASEWAQQYEDADSLASDHDHARSLRDHLLSLEGTTYASVGRVINRQPTPKQSSPIDALDRRSALLKEVNKWVRYSQKHDPELWSDPEDKQHLEAFVSGLKRKIKAGLRDDE